jgi:hypothetical protein
MITPNHKNKCYKVLPDLKYSAQKHVEFAWPLVKEGSFLFWPTFWPMFESFEEPAATLLARRLAVSFPIHF